MNTSINYSGFVDLLTISGSENVFSADQNEVHRAEPAMEATVEAGVEYRVDSKDRPFRE